MKRYLSSVLASAMLLGSLTTGCAYSESESESVEITGAATVPDVVVATTPEMEEELALEMEEELVLEKEEEPVQEIVEEEATPIEIQTLATSPESDFTFSAGTITGYHGPGGEVVVPATINQQTVTEIGPNAFRDNKSITSIVLPDTVSSLSGLTFSSCTNLTSVSLGSSLKTIGFMDFFLCVSLQNVVIPSSVNTIDFQAFQNCQDLPSIYIPLSVQTIREGAFSSCNSLVTVDYQGTEQDRAAMSIDPSMNEALLNATWIYNSAPPDTGVEASYPDWATTFIDYVSPSIMPDISVSNFALPANRGLIAQCIYNMSGDSATIAENHFSDGGEYASAIAWCNANNVMNGMSDTYFASEEDVTREQFTLILQKAAQALGRTSRTADESLMWQFLDTEEISSWAYSAVTWAVTNELMGGFYGELTPSGNITRTEVAVMLYNFDKL